MSAHECICSPCSHPSHGTELPLRPLSDEELKRIKDRLGPTVASNVRLLDDVQHIDGVDVARMVAEIERIRKDAPDLTMRLYGIASEYESHNIATPGDEDRMVATMREAADRLAFLERSSELPQGQAAHDKALEAEIRKMICWYEGHEEDAAEEIVAYLNRNSRLRSAEQSEDAAWTLSPEASARFLELLENPPKPTEALKELFRKHTAAVEDTSDLAAIEAMAARYGYRLVNPEQALRPLPKDAYERAAQAAYSAIWGNPRGDLFKQWAEDTHLHTACRDIAFAVLKSAGVEIEDEAHE